MADNLIPGLTQSSGCKILRRRELPIRGKTLVKVGDLVKPDTIVAEAELPGDVQIVRISELLGIEPKDVVSGLKIKVGEALAKDQLICEHKGLFGLFRSQFRSPCASSVDFISESLGHIGLRLPSQLLSVNAYCGGIVKDLQDGYSVELSTSATLVQGIFGVGGEQLGTISVLDVKPDEKLRVQHLPQELFGKIIVGGTLPDIEVLNRLSESGAKGLVVGGIDDQALHQFLGFDIGLAVTGNEEISFSLMVTEGFGNLAISSRVLNLFKKHDGQFACINGTTQIRAGAIRPEVVIPTEPTAEVETISQGLFVGSQVRLIRIPFFGKVGEVVDLPSKPEQLESGTFARILKVKLSDGKIVSVPRANAEILF